MTAAAIASLACKDRAYRLKRYERIKKAADDSLAISIKSIIDADEDLTVKREAVRESIGQYVAYVQKAQADADPDGDEHDVDDDAAKFENMARLEREGEHEDDEDDGGGDSGDGRHALEKLADLLVASGSHADRASALNYLLHDKAGTALAQRHKREETDMPTKLQKAFLEAKGDAVAFCKHLVDQNNADGTDEHALTALLTAHATKMFPKAKSGASAFGKLYESEEVVRRAVSLAKAFPNMANFMPLQVGGEANRGGDVSPNNPRSALDQINELVEEARKRAPFKRTTAQLFAEVYAMRPDLAQREREENRPRPGDHPSYPR
jgi:hypothetical protein